MAIIRKGRHVLEVVKHAQPCGNPPLFEVLAPDGFKWECETWSLHGDSVQDLRDRVTQNELVPAAADEDL